MLGDIQKRYGIKLFPHTRYISQGNIQTARPRPSYRIGGKVYTRQDEIGPFFGQQGQELSVSAATSRTFAPSLSIEERLLNALSFFFHSAVAKRS